jgi:hypothetical protein
VRFERKSFSPTAESRSERTLTNFENWFDRKSSLVAKKKNAPIAAELAGLVFLGVSGVPGVVGVEDEALGAL